ncbi:MAG: hypothetical protein ABJG88_08580 [Litorimonas sp.]
MNHFKYLFILSSIYGLILSGCIEASPASSSSTKLSRTNEVNGSTQDVKISESHTSSEHSKFQTCERHQRRDYTNALKTAASHGNPIVLIGEAHGNRNSIEFAHEYILTNIASGKSVIFAVEAPLNSGFQFDQVWNGEISIELAWKNMQESVFWGWSDGRQSCGLALMLTDLVEANLIENVKLFQISHTRSNSEQNIFKGHGMANQLNEFRKQLPKSTQFSTIALTGRRYQRLDPRFSVAEQSTMCGKMKQLTETKVLCIGTVGNNLPKLESRAKKMKALI